MTIGRHNLKKGPLTNLTDGGEGTSGYVYSKELREKISKSFAGKNHPNYGKHLSKSTKDKISFAQSGKKHWNYGRTGELNHLFGRRGKKCPWYGKHHSKKTKQKLSKGRMGERKSKIWSSSF